MKNLVHFSVNHSLFVNLLSIFFGVAGLVSLVAMRSEAFPNVNYDMVTVRTDYFGAPPEEIEKLITIELEDELKEVDGIDEMTSVSSENISMVLIQLDPDESDKAKVVNDIQRAVDRVQDLPDDAEDPVVTEVQSKNFPVINVSLSGDFDEHELQRIARDLELEFLDLPEVARVDRIGWRDREIWVEVDPKLVEDYHLSLEDVITALRNQNLNIPGGTLTTAQGDHLVRTIGEFHTPDEIRKVIIRANDLGNWIAVDDVAEVRDTFEDDDLLEKTYGHKAVTLTVIKKEKGDIIGLVQKVKETVTEFQKRAPAGLRVSYFDDFSYYVKRRLNVLKNNGIVGVIFVVLSLLYFMNAAMTLWTVVGGALAVLITFFLMNLCGMTINLITMFGLIMILGMVVDDSIIIAENVYRHMEKGKSPREAAITGTTEVAVPVMTTVLTTMVAFFPLFFMSGIMGKFIWAIPFVVIIALAASLFESLVILPSHLADFSKRPRPDQKDSQEKAWFLALQAKYIQTLKWILKHRYKATAGFFGIFFGAILLYIIGMRFVLFPQGLIEEFFIKFKTPVGTSLAETDRRVSQVEEMVLQLSSRELDNFVTRIGVMRESPRDPETDRGTNIGQIQVFLTPEKTRGRRNADKIIEELRGKIAPVKDRFEEITFEKVRAGPPVGKPVSIRIRGDRLETLEEVAEIFKKKLSAIEGLVDIRDDFDRGKTELRVRVDTQEATKAFLSIRDIATSVRNAIDGGVATTIKKTDEEIDVIVRYPKAETDTKDIFNFVHIPNSRGNLIPLKKVAMLVEKEGLHAVKHYDRKRVIYVTSDVDEKKVTPLEVERVMTDFYHREISKKYPNITIGFGGEQEETRESLQDFRRALFLAVFMIFIILAANFNGILLPLIVMAAIPFGISGVIFAFFLHGQPLSFMAMLGLIGLSGVVVNDSIVLVDFIKTLRQEGMGRFDSVLEAGRLRLRPVILTTITTVVGLLPVAYGLGGSDPFLKPMALAIGWGLAFATILTLLIVPCLTVVTDDLHVKVTEWWKRLRGFTPSAK